MSFITNYGDGALMGKTGGITLRLAPEVGKKIRALAQEHHYEPTEVVLLGMGVIPLLLREKALGHKFCVMNSNGEIVKEFILPEPKILQQSSIDEEARKIIESAFPFSVSLRDSIADFDPNLPKEKRKDRGSSSSISH